MLFLVFPAVVFAGDGVTIVFKSGSTAYLNNGFKQIEKGISKSEDKTRDSYYVKLDLGGAPFYLNLETVAVVCRDRCKSMEIVQPPKSDGNN